MGNKSSAPSADPLHLGDKIKASVQKTNAAVAASVAKTNAGVNTLGHQIDAGFHDQKFLNGLQKTTQILVGVASLTPLGRGLVQAAVLIADKTDHGSASKYLGSGNMTNGTLSMAPGGLLAQTIANVVTNNRSGQELTALVPDPKKMIVKDVSTVGKAAIKDPHSTLSVSQQVVTGNVQGAKKMLINVKSTAAKVDPQLGHTLASANVIHAITPIKGKPSIHEVIKAVGPAAAVSTISHVIAKANTVVKPSLADLGAAVHKEVASVVPESSLGHLAEKVNTAPPPDPILATPIVAAPVAMVALPAQSTLSLIAKTPDVVPQLGQSTVADVHTPAPAPKHDMTLWEWFMGLLMPKPMLLT